MAQKLTKEEFIERSNLKHNFKYDYSKVEYNGGQQKVCIICPEHGEFWQLPERHYGRGDGCPICRWKKAKESIRKVEGMTTEEFIKRAKIVHGDKYDYSKVVYENTETKVYIICPEHGEFWQTPHHHLKGHGCPQCGKNDLSEQKLTKIIKENFNNVIAQYKPSFLFANSKNQTIDIFLPDENIGIEYQGRQHFKPISRFGGKEEFEKTIERDKRKFKKCQENGIEIKYFTYEKSNEIPPSYLNKIYTNETELINDIKRKKT